MKSRIFSFIIGSILLLSLASAMTVYGDFQDATQSATINAGETINFNVDFFSMNPPMNTKVGLYSGSTLVQSFLDSSISEKTYYHTYSYTASTAGTFEIRIIGTDKINTDSEYLTLKVNSAPPVNHAPVITSVPISQVNEGASYYYDVAATDADGDVLTYSLTEKPSWLSINSVTGVISGTAPLVSADTNFDIEVEVSDGTNVDTQYYTLKVKDSYVPPTNHAPVITSVPISQVNEGASYYYDVAATDSDGDALTYSLIINPPWLSINPTTGVISGTAPLVSANTEYGVTVRVSDGKDGIDTQPYTLTVKDIPCPPPTNHAPVINPISNQQINEGQSYSYHVIATDSDGDVLTYSLTEKPSWLSINSVTGVISGTAPYVSSDTPFSITVKASDGKGGIDTQPYTLTVKDSYVPPTNHAPVITSVPITNINEGNNYNYNVDATDSDGDVLTYSLTEKPSWLSINSVTGVISGTAPYVSANTPFSITVKVSDGIYVDTQSYTLTIKDSYVPPCDDKIKPVITLLGPNPQTVTKGSSYYEYGATAWDNEDGDLTSEIQITGTVNTNVVGTYTITYNVEDNAGNHAITKTRTVKVVAGDSSCSTCKKTTTTAIDNRLEEHKYFDQFETGKVIYIYDDTPKTVSWFQKIINSIVNAFKWLFGIK
ncbi:MAG: putative Ig domain-containing protein [Candidatus Pacearchaeota archaeon]|nr:putative Ig domain-containing protein [Candidatus Pacearchaeota archaeon]